MAAAVLYGAYSFLFSGSSVNKKKLAGQGQVPVNEFVTDLIKRILKSDTTATDQLILERSAAKWKKDPFLAMKKREITEAETEKQQKIITREDLIGAFNYAGYMEMGKIRLAIINGMEYQAGDTLAIKGAVLQKISPKEVHISLKEAQGVVVVPIEDTR